MVIRSEAEFERLYQEFVQKGGGFPTLTTVPSTTDIANSQSNQNVLDVSFNTPAAYYQEQSSITSSPSTLSELQAKQLQYNRSKALQTISSEIAANNFSNPYTSRADIGKLTYNDYMNSAGGTAIGSMATAFNRLSDTGIGGSPLIAATIFGALLANTGIDFEKLIIGALIGGAAISMFTNLSSHTDSQLSDLPKTLEDVSSLTDMNKTFGEPSDGCDIFNQLMGILSGAFDGALDFINSAGSDLMNMLNATGIPDFINSVTSKVNEIIDSIVGPISDAINSVISQVTDAINQALAPLKDALNQALGPIKDMFNQMGNMMKSALGAINDIANQIASEIAGILDLASQLASKLQALAMAGAMMDPCKLAVLLNVGSPELKNAAGLLNAPMEMPLPNINIPTEVDDRADPEEVTARMQEARQQAATEPGVPQSPFTDLAQIYQPLNAYLHDLFSSVKGIFDTETKYGSVPTEDGLIIAALPVTGSNSQTSEEQEISSEFTPSVPAQSSNTGRNIEQGDAESLDAFGGEGAEIIQPTPNTQVASSNTRRSAEQSLGSSSSSITLVARARTEWYNKYGKDLKRLEIRSKRYSRKISSILNSSTTWSNESQKSQARIYKQAFDSIVSQAKQQLAYSKTTYKYTVQGADRDPTKEREKQELLNKTHGPNTKIILDRLTRQYDDNVNGWESIKPASSS